MDRQGRGRGDIKSARLDRALIKNRFRALIGARNLFRVMVDSNDSRGSAALYHQLTVNLCQLAMNVLCMIVTVKPARLCAVLKNDAYGHAL